MQPAQQGFAADRVQRPLRCRFQPRLMTGRSAGTKEM
jgi:hypothetical protein